MLGLMSIAITVSAVVSAVGAQGQSIVDLSGRGCNIWKSISKQMQTDFTSGGECNDLARSCIRLAFHDCGTWDKSQKSSGGCDGSVVLNAEERSRPINRAFQSTVPGNCADYVLDMVKKHSNSKDRVSHADMIVFAGNKATRSCPGGPRVQTYVGRKDSNRAAPDGKLPLVTDRAEALLELFQDKGFNAEDLAALVGSHSTSRQRGVDPSQSGAPQDRTPGEFDTDFYQLTLDVVNTGVTPAGVFVFTSDKELATFDRTRKYFKTFAQSQPTLNRAFKKAMEQMTLLGNKRNELVDCTSAL